MGTSVKFIESTISIELADSLQLMQFLSDYIERYSPVWGYVTNDSLVKNCERNDFYSVMREIGYEVALCETKFNYQYEIIGYNAEKLGSDAEIFKLLARFIQCGYIEMLDEDKNERWRWSFGDKQFKEEHQHVIWK